MNRSGNNQNLPTEFKCHGQFCKLNTIDPAALQSEGEDRGSNRERAMLIAKQVLSSSELHHLEESGKLLQLGVTKRDPLAFKSVSQRSITLAQQENRLVIGDSHDESESWRSYPKNTFPKGVVPDQNDNNSNNLTVEIRDENLHGDDKKRHRDRQKNSLAAPTQTSKGRADWGENHGEVHGGAANYYKEVKVCGVCAQVYSLLDQSRDLVHVEEEKKMEDERVRKASDYTDQRDLKMKNHKMQGKHQHDGQVMEEEHATAGIMGTELGRQLFGASVQNPVEDLYNQSGIYSIGEGGENGDEFDEPTTFLSPGKPRKGDKRRKNNSNSNSNSNSNIAPSDNPLRSPSLPRTRATWKDHLDKEDENEFEEDSSNSKKKKKSSSKAGLAKGNDPHFEVLDDYLHGQKKYSNTVDSRKKSQLANGHLEQRRMNDESQMYHAKILIGDPDKETAQLARSSLEPSGYIVNWVENGADCVEMMEASHYDAVLLSKDMEVLNAFDVTKWVRSREKERRISNAKLRAEINVSNVGFKSPQKQNKVKDERVVKPDLPVMPVIIFTNDVKPDSLKSYMEAGMDGCVSKPLDPPSLVSTMKAAIPDHLQHLQMILESRGEIPSSKSGGPFEPSYGPQTRVKPRAFITGAMGTVQGDDGSSAMVANTMALSASFTKEDFSTGGMFQYDSDTQFPYAVLDSSKHGNVNPNAKTFNMVVCHDLFDTLERLKIFLRPIIARYPGMQILLWNYPGQAFTEFREGQTLNNDYHAACLHELLQHVGHEVSERSERAFVEDENSRDESHEIATDGYIHY